jgi:ribosome recycling factor
MSDAYLSTLNDDMNKVLDTLKRDLLGVRTGRASPGLVENVQVHVQSYGSNMPLNNLASITAPDARLLVINPWDKSTLGDIERAIATAGLGLNPSNDGQIIRVPIPPLTGERRQGLGRDDPRAIRRQAPVGGVAQPCSQRVARHVHGHARHEHRRRQPAGEPQPADRGAGDGHHHHEPGVGDRLHARDPRR